MMSNIDFRTMSLAARGLLYSMKMECWVNRRVHADPARLARMLGFDPAEVTSLLPEVMPFFRSDGDRIVSPELDAYRAHLESLRIRKSEGGKKGAESTNSRRAGSPTGESPGVPTGMPQVSRRGGRGTTRGSLVQNSQDQNSQIHGHEGESYSTFVNDYEAASRGT